ncbi:hypothetical protein D3C78_1354290 [compost metagenome]
MRPQLLELRGFDYLPDSVGVFHSQRTGIAQVDELAARVFHVAPGAEHDHRNLGLGEPRRNIDYQILRLAAIDAHQLFAQVDVVLIQDELRSLADLEEVTAKILEILLAPFARPGDKVRSGDA